MNKLTMNRASSTWHFSWLSLRQRVVVGFFTCLLVLFYAIFVVNADASFQHHFLISLNLLLFAASFTVGSRAEQLLLYSRSNVMPMALRRFLLHSLIKRLHIIGFISLIAITWMLEGGLWSCLLQTLALWCMAICSGLAVAKFRHGGHQTQLLSGLLLTAWCVLIIDSIHVFDFILPTTVQLACVVSWPVYIMHWIRQSTNPSKRCVDGLEETSRRSLYQQAIIQLRRFSRFSASKLGSQDSFELNTLLLPLSVFTVLTLLYMTFAQPFAAHIHLHRLLLVLGAALIMSQHLVVRDLHWRHLLRPQGTSSHRFATKLFSANIIFFGVPFLAAILVGYFLERPTFEIALRTFFFSLIDLIALFTIAITIASKDKAHRSVYYGLMAIALIFFLAHGIDYLSGRDGRILQLMFADWRYPTAMLIFSTFTLRKANRVWSNQRLLNFLNS